MQSKKIKIQFLNEHTTSLNHWRDELLKLDKIYFHKDANHLSAREAAMIAACLPNPKKFTVVPASRYVSIRSSKIVNQMNNLRGDSDIEALIK